MVFCAASLITLISCWVQKYSFISAINLGHCLTLLNSFCVYIFLCACNKDSYVEIVLISTVFWFVGAITLFWSFWINLSFYIPILFFYFQSWISTFLHLWGYAVSLLKHYLYFQSCSSSCLMLLLLIQALKHLWMHHLPLSLGYLKLVITFPLCNRWLIISSCVLTLHLLIISASLQDTVVSYSMATGFPYCSWFAFYYSFILLIAKINLHSFNTLYARRSLNYSICVKKWWFQFFLMDIILQRFHCL